MCFQIRRSFLSSSLFRRCFVSIIKMKTDHLNIEDSSYHLGGELINILDFDRSSLKLDKKIGKILLFITLIMLTKIKNL